MISLIAGRYFSKLLNHPEIIFVIIAFVFGLFFLKVTPPGCVPDEPSHIYRSCEIASGILYSKTPAKKTVLEEKLKNIIPEKNENEFHFANRYSPVMYIASSAGIKLAEAVSDNSKFIFYFGRFCNLLLYIFLIAAAIRITPVFKYHFMFTALFPMSLFLGMSYNADSFNTAFAFLFFAYIFRLMFQNSEAGRKQCILLSLLTLIGAFCKGLLYPAVMFLFIRFSKYEKIYIWLFVLFSVLLSFVWIHINYNNLNPLHAVINNPLYFISEPYITVKRILLTTISDFHLYLKGLVGILGWMSIVFPKDVYTLTYLVFVAASFVLGEKVLLKYKITALLTFCLLYISFQYMHLIYWSDMNSDIIYGVQGRYFLAAMPFVFLILSTDKLKISENYKSVFKVFLIIFIIYLLNVALTGLNSYYNELGLSIIL